MTKTKKRQPPSKGRRSMKKPEESLASLKGKLEDLLRSVIRTREFKEAIAKTRRRLIVQGRVGECHFWLVLACSRNEFALSPREQQILKQLALGQRNKKIAGIIGISPATVAAHIKKVFLKLGLHSRLDLATLVPREFEAEGGAATNGSPCPTQFWGTPF